MADGPHPGRVHIAGLRRTPVPADRLVTSARLLEQGGPLPQRLVEPALALHQAGRLVEGARLAGPGGPVLPPQRLVDVAFLLGEEGAPPESVHVTGVGGAPGAETDPAPTPRRRRARAWRRLARIAVFSAFRGATAAVGSGAVTAVIWWWQK